MSSRDGVVALATKTTPYCPELPDGKEFPRFTPKWGMSKKLLGEEKSLLWEKQLGFWVELRRIDHHIQFVSKDFYGVCWTKYGEAVGTVQQISREIESLTAVSGLPSPLHPGKLSIAVR
ncbi:predicted protein [Histoplasma capsulatum var. duboisii H88]|uniref:Predicted protein n=1 Tax=Ajellomyces capsulatus (strain H88) TaxID=544711 RepID=F0U6D6_AJEC8|nr:predicted protein [Histoplasma capsulatum var. duboisii H88]